jgi:starch phosphorylase
MKVLANGGLNLSALDGWWAEAYAPEVGWAIGAAEAPGPHTDAADAEQLYCRLEQEAVPMFYDRDARGIPGAWVKRVRASISSLAPLFSSNRMLQQYLDAFYRPAAAAFRRRREDQAKLGKALHAWHTKVLANWHEVHFGEPRVERRGHQWYFDVPVYLGAVSSEWLKVELYADPEPAREPVRQSMTRGDAIPGAINGYMYSASVPASRPDWHFTPRVMAYHAEALTPMESALVLWQR